MHGPSPTSNFVGTVPPVPLGLRPWISMRSDRPDPVRMRSRHVETAYSLLLQNRNRNLEISTAPTKAKSWAPAYWQTLISKKSIDNESDPESQAGRQSDGYDGWCLELRREGGIRRRGWFRIGFVEEQCFQFWVKELWRDCKRWRFGEFVG